MLFFLVSLALFGLIVGAIARFLVPGDDPMGILGTMALGIVGSFVGGFVFALLFGRGDGSHYGGVGLVGSVVGAVLALLVYRAATGRRHVLR